MDLSKQGQRRFWWEQFYGSTLDKKAANRLHGGFYALESALLANLVGCEGLLLKRRNLDLLEGKAFRQASKFTPILFSCLG